MDENIRVYCRVNHHSSTQGGDNSYMMHESLDTVSSVLKLTATLGRERFVAEIKATYLNLRVDFFDPRSPFFFFCEPVVLTNDKSRSS